MAVQPIGGVSAAAAAGSTGAAAPAGAARPTAGQSKDSTIVISTVTRTRDDGSTVTTITYADGHTKVETTPPKYSATQAKGNQVSGTQASGTQAGGTEGGGRVTAVNLLA